MVCLRLIWNWLISNLYSLKCDIQLFVSLVIFCVFLADSLLSERDRFFPSHKQLQSVSTDLKHNSKSELRSTVTPNSYDIIDTSYAYIMVDKGWVLSQFIAKHFNNIAIFKALADWVLLVPGIYAFDKELRRIVEE